MNASSAHSPTHLLGRQSPPRVPAPAALLLICVVPLQRAYRLPSFATKQE
jgi:hypothetical protein